MLLLLRRTFIATLLVVLSNLAWSEDSMSGEQWLLAKYDVNGDQIISIDEIAEKRKKLFSRMDLDLNGEVSFGEYEEIDAQKRQLLLKARFNKLDLDQDGHLNAEEYSSYLGSFERFDHDGDGNISAEEMKKKNKGIFRKMVTKDEDHLCLLWVCIRKNME